MIDKSEIIRLGKITGKRNKFGMLGFRKYLICVEFDEPFNRKTGEKTWEFIVSSGFYEDIVIGARVKGIFDQAPEGLRPVTCVI